MNRNWSPFGPPKAKDTALRPPVMPPPETVEPTPEPLPYTAEPDALVSGGLSEQVGAALKPIVKEHTLNMLATKVGVTSNTMARCVSGVGMKLSTLEKLCVVLGWTVTITDPEGRKVATGPTKEIGG